MQQVPSILVIGSSNTDMVIKADKFPLPGETILGGTFFMFPGGKGANQAVSAARLDGRVTLITKIGNDIFGKQALQQFQREGIRTEFIMEDAEHPSGVALITVDAKGENTIVVAQGANAFLTTEDLISTKNEIEVHAILLMQMEIPLTTILYAAKIAVQKRLKVILNPAPATTLPAEIYGMLYLITPNKSEAEVLSEIKITDNASIDTAAKKLKEKGVQNVIITLGSRGAYLLTEAGGRFIDSPHVKAIDTTAAGDIFNGALAVAIAEEKDLYAAVNFANQAAAISVTKMGAQASAPFRNELEETTLIQ
ncbi:MAG TPA: ribokinase [Flavitalea sp.]|nr:ribokinase [Flavitalea sp.]